MMARQLADKSPKFTCVGVCAQDFMQSSGEGGVLLVSLGTIAELGGGQCSPTHLLRMNKRLKLTGKRLKCWCYTKWTSTKLSRLNVSLLYFLGIVRALEKGICWCSPLRFRTCCADVEQIGAMADAFAALPCKVLWRLAPKEVQDAAALLHQHLGNNTKACCPASLTRTIFASKNVPVRGACLPHEHL